VVVAKRIGMENQFLRGSSGTDDDPRKQAHLRHQVPDRFVTTSPLKYHRTPVLSSLGFRFCFDHRAIYIACLLLVTPFLPSWLTLNMPSIPTFRSPKTSSTYPTHHVLPRSDKTPSRTSKMPYRSTKWRLCTDI
jgi:hypothetical protein